MKQVDLRNALIILSALNATAPGNMKKSRAIPSDLRTDVPSSHHSPLSQGYNTTQPVEKVN
jgi:hypothetical protein